MTEQSATL